MDSRSSSTLQHRPDHRANASTPQIPTLPCRQGPVPRNAEKPVTFRAFAPSDAEALSTLLSDFQDFLKDIDPEKCLKREAGFGKRYFDLLLRDLRQNDGCIIVCTVGPHLVGFSSCIVSKPSSYDELEYVDGRVGRITELYVDDGYRGRGIGSKFIALMEDVLRAKGCTRVEIGVNAWNTRAHMLYEKLGYQERFVRLSKPL